VLFIVTFLEWLIYSFRWLKPTEIELRKLKFENKNPAIEYWHLELLMT